MTTTTGFFDAVRSGDMAAVDEHLRGDSTLVSTMNESGVSALLWAYYNGQHGVAERLLASGVELNIFEWMPAPPTASRRSGSLRSSGARRY